MSRSIDAAAVPAGGAAAPVNRNAGTAESKLCELMGRSLNLERVEPDDDFFDLGGTSRQAMEIMAEIEHEFGRKLAVDVLIDAPTPAALAAQLETGERPDASPLLLRFQAGDSRWPPLFLVHGLRGHIFVAPDLITALDPRRPVYGIQARGVAGDEPLADSVDAAARDYLDAIETVVRGGPFHLGSFCAGALIALEMSALLGDSRPGASAPILIDPLVMPPAHRLRDGRFGRVRLALWRFRSSRLIDPGRIQRSLARANEAVRYWRPDIDDAAASERLGRVSANMQHLVRCHIVSDAPLSPVLLTSEQRAAKVMNPDSFWFRKYGERMRVHVVATHHRTIFTEERHRVFRHVNELLNERDNPLS